MALIIKDIHNWASRGREYISWTFMDAFEAYYNWVSVDMVSVSPFRRYVMTTLRDKISNKYNEPSLSGAQVVVSFTLK